jgi:hypothetical protein
VGFFVLSLVPRWKRSKRVVVVDSLVTPSELRYILQEIKKLGYQFIDLEDWTRKNTVPIRPEPIVRDTLEIKTRGN